MQFVPVFGSSHDPSIFKGSTLVLPTTSAGMSSNIAADLFVMNEGAIKVGYLRSAMISPMVQNDVLSVEGAPPGQMQMPVEVFVSQDKRYTFFIFRSGIVGGKMLEFGQVFTAFVGSLGFTDIKILTATVSPIKRERESNRQIPEVFAYANNTLYQSYAQSGKNYYEAHQIRKFGWWLADCKRKPHQELSELMGSGAAKKLLKMFDKNSIPVSLFIIFTPGGIDFVGGYTYYFFLKQNFGANGQPVDG